MALFLNELKPLRVYNGPYYYPIDMKDRLNNSIVYLLTPDIKSTITFLNSKNNKPNSNSFNSYFVEKNIQFVINKNLSENSNLNINGENIKIDYALNESLEYTNSFDTNYLLTENSLFYTNKLEEYKTTYSGDNKEEIRIFFPDYVDKILKEETIKTQYGTYNISNIFRNILFNERMKSQKDVLNLYDEIKKQVRFIRYTYTAPNLYKNRNIYYDWSYYTEIFFRNNKELGNRGNDLFFQFINRFIKDSRFSSYNKKTIVIPILDWIKDKEEDVFDYKKNINPLSLIWRASRYNPNIFKDEWKDNIILLYTDTGYLVVDCNNFNPERDKIKLINLVRDLIRKNPIEISSTNMDSKAVILTKLVDKLSKGNIKIKNLTGSTKNLSKEDIEKSFLMNVPEYTNDDDIKKAVLVNTLEKAAAKSKDVEEALDNIDPEDQQVKQLLLDLQSEDGIKMNAARRERYDKIRDGILTKEIKNKTVKQLLEEFEKNNEMPESSVPIDTIDESWHHMKFANFNKIYDMNADIVAMFNFFNTVTHPMNILNLKVEDSSTSEDYKETWTCNYEDAETGKRSSMILDIPKLIDNRVMRLRGNEKILIGQLMLLPITKTDTDTVQIVSNYNKIFIRRKSPNGVGKSNPVVNKLLKAIPKYTGKDVKFIMGDNSKMYFRYKLPIDFIDLGSAIAKIEFPNGDYISFNLDELKKIPIDRDSLTPSEKKLSDEDLEKRYLFIKVKNGKKTHLGFDSATSNTGYSLLRELDIATKGEFNKIYNSMSVSKRLMYSECSILAIKIPTVIVLSYNIGLQQLLDRLSIKYEFSEKRPSTNDLILNSKSVIKFDDGYLIYTANTPETSMLFNGLSECDFSGFSIKEINSKDMWLSILDDFGGRIKADGLDNFYDLMFDPITVEICKILNIPSNYVDGLIYASNLLVDNKYIKHSDLSGNRLRTNEVIVGHLYQVLSKAFGAYRNEVKRNKQSAVFTAKKSAVIDSILNHDQTSTDLSTLTPLLEAEAYNKVTFKGLSGMNSDRAYSIDKRTYDKSMLGVLSLSTGFAGTVGINRQTTIDAGVINKRGFISARKPKDLNNIKTFSYMEALSPLAINHDDPIRIGMAFTQTSQHSMTTKSSMPNLVTTGADEALPYLTSNKFSYKFKGKNGVVKEITKDYIIIEDTDTNTKDLVDLRETIRKNSDGGFYITTKLDCNVKVGQKLKYNDIVAYDKKSYSNAIGHKGDDQSLSYNMGTMTKFAIMNTDLGFEDSVVVDSTLSEALTTEICVQKEIDIPKGSNVYNLVKVGQEIQEGEPLLIFQDAFDEKEANELLLSLTGDDEKQELSDLGRKQVRAKTTGIIQDIKIFRTCEIDQLSPTLQKIVKDYESKINKLKNIMTKNKIDKQYILEPTYKLAQEGKLKNLDGIKIEFYIKVSDKFGVGDKLVFNQALKGVNSYVIERGQEAYTDYRPNEYVNAFLTLTGVMARMVASAFLQGLTNKLLIELTRQCQEDLGIKWRPLQDILDDDKK